VSVPTIWSRLTRVVWLLLMAAAVMLVAMWYLPQIRKNQAMREELARLDGEVRLEEDKIHRKKAMIDALRNDPKAVERLAREKLGLARPGETVVHFEPAPAAHSSPPPAP
jgi:cell division protein FtsB